MLSPCASIIMGPVLGSSRLRHNVCALASMLVLLGHLHSSAATNTTGSLKRLRRIPSGSHDEHDTTPLLPYDLCCSCCCINHAPALHQLWSSPACTAPK